jgi:hypothetical protein
VYFSGRACTRSVIEFKLAFVNFTPELAKSKLRFFLRICVANPAHAKFERSQNSQLKLILIPLSGQSKDPHATRATNERKQEAFHKCVLSLLGAKIGLLDTKVVY